MLKAITAQYVMLRPGAPSVRAAARARHRAHPPVDARCTGHPGAHYAAWFDEASDDAGRLRAVVDQAASLTDTAALAVFGKLRSR